MSNTKNPINAAFGYNSGSTEYKTIYVNNRKKQRNNEL